MRCVAICTIIMIWILLFFSFVFGLLIDSHWDEKGVCSMPNPTIFSLMLCAWFVVINQCDRSATLPIFSYRFENVDRSLNWVNNINGFWVETFSSSVIRLRRQEDSVSSIGFTNEMLWEIKRIEMNQKPHKVSSKNKNQNIDNNTKKSFELNGEHNL